MFLAFHCREKFQSVFFSAFLIEITKLPVKLHSIFPKFFLLNSNIEKSIAPIRTIPLKSALRFWLAICHVIFIDFLKVQIPGTCDLKRISVLSENENGTLSYLIVTVRNRKSFNLNIIKRSSWFCFFF